MTDVMKAVLSFACVVIGLSALTAGAIGNPCNFGCKELVPAQGYRATGGGGDLEPEDDISWQYRYNCWKVGNYFGGVYNQWTGLEDNELRFANLGAWVCPAPGSADVTAGQGSWCPAHCQVSCYDSDS